MWARQAIDAYGSSERRKGPGLRAPIVACLSSVAGGASGIRRLGPYHVGCCATVAPALIRKTLHFRNILSTLRQGLRNRTAPES